MKPSRAERYQRIQSFAFDPPDAQFTFAQKLAKESEWTAEFTQRVIEEYKRFAFLAVVAGHRVAPSYAVDQAWHLHLTFTQSYWEEFCPKVLGRPLHHYPAQGGATEQAELQEWYCQTLDSYVRILGETPPADIWPPPAEHAQSTNRVVRINKAEYWLIRKPAAPAPGEPVALLPALPIPLPEQQGELSPQLDLYEIAQLAGGKDQLLPTVMMYLIEQGVLHADEATGKITLMGPLPRAAHPLEQRVLSVVKKRGGATYNEIRRELDVKAPIQELEQRLKSLGLVNYSEQSIQGCLPGLCVVVAFGCGGVLLVTLTIGSTGGTLLSLLIACIAIFWLLVRRPYRTHQGDQLLKQRRTEWMAGLSTATEHEAAALMATQLVAFSGLVALSGTSFDSLHKVLAPKRKGGIGCGGDGCGGDGGCGG
jgi:uncharacterized protein (TIGR04222 family)